MDKENLRGKGMKAWNAIESICISASSVLVLVVTVAVTADVLMRWAFNHPIAGVFELTELSLIGIVFLALPRVQRTDGHVRVDILRDRAKSKGRNLLDILALLFGFAIMVLFVWRGTLSAVEMYKRHLTTQGSVTFVRWPFESLLVFGCALAAVWLGFQLIKQVQLLLGPETAVDPPVEKQS